MYAKVKSTEIPAPVLVQSKPHIKTIRLLLTLTILSSEINTVKIQNTDTEEIVENYSQSQRFQTLLWNTMRKVLLWVLKKKCTRFTSSRHTSASMIKPTAIARSIQAEIGLEVNTRTDTK